MDEFVRISKVYELINSIRPITWNMEEAEDAERWRTLMEKLKELPTVQITVCKQCSWWDEENGECGYEGILGYRFDFCSRAKRRGDKQ